MDSKMDLSDEQMLALVRQVFAEATIVSATLFAGDHTNLNYDLRLANPTIDAALKAYTTISAQEPWKEIHLLGLITSETGVPVPRVLHFDDSGSQLACPWALCTRLPGQPLSLVLNRLDEWELESIGYEMGRYLAHLHTIPLTSFGELLDPAQQSNEKEAVLAQVQFWLDECVIHDLLARKDAEMIEQIFVKTAALNRHQACLNHGNYTEHNIIVERGTPDFHVTGVLDFKSAVAGSPEQDMSRLFNRSFDKRPTFQKGLLDGYTEVGELGALFWERLGLYRIYTYLQDILAHKERRPESRKWNEQLLTFVATYTP